MNTINAMMTNTIRTVYNMTTSVPKVGGQYALAVVAIDPTIADQKDS